MPEPSSIRTILSAALFCAAGLLLLASPAQKADWKAEVKTENGVRVVHNPATPAKGPDGAQRRFGPWTKSPMRRMRASSSSLIGPPSRTARFWRICSMVFAPDMQTSTAGWDRTKR